MSVKAKEANSNPITAFVVSRIESTFGLPDGEVAVSFIALGFGDDINGEEKLWLTWSLSEASCLDAARAVYPQALYIGVDVPVHRGART